MPRKLLNWFQRVPPFTICKVDSYSDGYGGSSEQLSPFKNLHEFRDFVGRSYRMNSPQLAVTSSLITVNAGVWGKKNEHVAVLDCDGIAGMVAATTCLTGRGIKFALIESTPDRFWVVTDRRGDYESMTDFVKSVPGVDQQWVNLCAIRECFHLRITPRQINGIYVWPEPIGQNDLADGYCLAWYKWFVGIVTDPSLRREAEIWKAINNGTYEQQLADPNTTLLNSP